MKFLKFYQTIEYYKTLVDIPNSDEYPTPTDESISSALKAIKYFEKINIYEPNTMINSDGVIGVYWKINNNYASIDFELNGICTWCTIINDISSSGQWSLNEQQLPQDILNIIKHEVTT